MKPIRCEGCQRSGGTLIKSNTGYRCQGGCAVQLRRQLLRQALATYRAVQKNARSWRPERLTRRGYQVQLRPVPPDEELGVEHQAKLAYKPVYELSPREVERRRNRRRMQRESRRAGRAE